MDTLDRSRVVRKGKRHAVPNASGSSPATSPEVGERVRLAVHGLDPHGDGVARSADGLVFFVEGALPGDQVVATVTHRARRYARARLERLIQPSPHRVALPCPVADACGGCPLMGLDYPVQLEAKRNLVVDAFQRIGGMAEAERFVRDVLGMAYPWAYRNKAQYPVATDEDGRPVVGFFRRGTHQVVPALDCKVQHPTNVRIAAATRDVVEELGLEVYDEATGLGWVRHVVSRASQATGQGLLVLVTTDRPEPRPGTLMELAKRVKDRVPELIGVVQNVNPHRTNVILGRENRLVWGQDHFEERVGPLRLKLSATAFFQVNTRQAEVLYQEVRGRIAAFLERLGLRRPAGRLFDLYCGVGGIGLMAAELVQELVGVEAAPEAVADARENAARNGIRNARFVVGAVEDVLPREMGRLSGGAAGGPDGARSPKAGASTQDGPVMVIVDPPRKGLDAGVVKALGALAPDLLVYVSCNPTTMARDLRQFLELTRASGVEYEWGPLQPVDMFPHTAHVEVVGHLMRKGSGR